MTSIVSNQPVADPFASQRAKRYSSPFSSPRSTSSKHPNQTPPLPPPPPQPSFIMPSVRPSTGDPLQRNLPPTSGQAGADDFTPFGTPPAAASSQTVGARVNNSQSPPVPIPMPPSTTADHHMSAPVPRPRNRQSHNPSSTLVNASPPKAEHLTDEYVLHPSVYTYKQAHPRRPMVGFGPYVLLQTLGEGEFGKVKLGVHTEYGVEVAIKLIRRGSLEDETRAGKVEREIDVLKTLKHPNIVRMFDVIDTEKYIGIVLEFAGGGELFDYILANRYLKEKDAQKLFAQLISGVDYLHKKHIVHRDLKLENLLLDKHRNIIITDFGFANRFDKEQSDLMATSCGSPCYAAPELVVSEGLYVGSAVDIWSCGVILYAMLSGYLPYDDDPANPDGDNINLLYKYIMSTKLNFPDHMSAAAKNLLQIMLVPDPQRRCRIEQIMQHPWLASYRDIFTRSVDEQEYLFQENMYRKSQVAKKELADRRRVQVDGKQAKQVMARSQSSAPGSVVSASMLDQQRRAGTNRHHSALPTTNTMPMHLNQMDYGSHPSAEEPLTRPHVLLSSDMQRAATEDTASTSAIPIPKAPPSSFKGPTGFSSSLPGSNAISLNDQADDERMDLEESAPSQLESGSDPAKTPMSSNKNRHTIQVEYDGEASYERMQEILRAKRAAADQNASIPVMPAPTPIPGLQTSPERKLQALGDFDMESGSSDMGHTAEDTFESVTPAPTQILTPPADTPPATVVLDHGAEEVPPAINPSEPITPSKKGKGPATNPEPMSPTTPRPKRPDTAEDVATPRQSRLIPTTPRSGGKRADSMPAPSFSPPKAQDAIPVPPSNPQIASSGLPKAAPKRDRSRKGMSLDKFGLAKLLGTAASSSSVDVSRPPPSASAYAAASLQSRRGDEMETLQETGQLQRTGSQTAKRTSMVRQRPGEGDAKTEKKTRRRTLQLMVNRNSMSKEAKPTTASNVSGPLAPRDMNPPPVSRTPATASSKLQSPAVVIDSAGIQPTTSAERGQSSPSIVTVDAFTAKQASPPGNKTASSSAARKVMDWFRKKSLARDTLVSLKQAGVKSDSASSFVRVSDSPIPGSSVEKRDADEEADKEDPPSQSIRDQLYPMSSTSSISPTTEGMSTLAVEDAPITTPTELPIEKARTTSSSNLPLPTVVAVAPPASSGPPTPTRIPLASAASKTNIVPQAAVTSTTSLLSPGSHSSMPMPSRSKTNVPDFRPSNQITTVAARPIISASANSPPTKIPIRTSSSTRADEFKMRVHTGLVDQSALSSKPPREVINEAIKVLQDMGMEIKKENDFKLRCTRVRRRKAGATTGLGLGSVMSVGSGMSPFTLMSSASTSKTDTRGLPLPASPSGTSILSSAGGGLKGMLLRRGSSFSATHGLQRSDSEVGSPSASTIGFGSPIPGTPNPTLVPAKEPLYGEHSVDSGDEVKFVVELCRIKNLPGLYVLSIKRLRGTVWSFKFIYQTVIERCETLTH